MGVAALARVDAWPVDHVAALAVTATTADVRVPRGDPRMRFRLASLTKPLAAWAILIAWEEGIVELDAPLDPAHDRVPDGVTLRHLLAHAAGFGFDGEAPVTGPARRRIYSNTGIDRAADVVARAAAMPFAEYLRIGVFEPLGMDATALDGPPAHGASSTIDDMHRFVNELIEPRLVSPGTRDEAVRPQWPELEGIVPGVGRFSPCPWGLGFELHGAKAPHWMGRSNSAEAFGHFGGAGTMMWVDPSASGGPVAVVALTDRPFDQWSIEALRGWPELSDAVLAEAASGAGD